jgi:hypothetical protein
MYVYRVCYLSLEYVCLSVCLSVEYVFPVEYVWMMFMSVKFACLSSMCLSVDVSVCWIYLLSYTAYVCTWFLSVEFVFQICLYLWHSVAYVYLSRMSVCRICLFSSQDTTLKVQTYVRKFLIVNFCYTIFQKYWFSETTFYSLFDKLLQLQNNLLQRNRLLLGAGSGSEQ